MKSSHSSLLPILVVLTLVVSGCASNLTTEPEGVATASTMRMLIMTHPQSLDPAFAYDEVSRVVGMNVFSGLVRFDDYNDVEGDIAQTWTVSEDGKTYTFRLKQGVLFHNGREVLAEDFAFSLNRCLDPSTNSPMAHYLTDIDGADEVVRGEATEACGINPIADYVLEITLVEPQPFFLAKMATPAGWVVPPEEVGEECPAWGNGLPVGTGPYTVKEVRPGDRIILEPFDEFYRDKPILEGLELVVVEDPSVGLFMYAQDELDYVPLQPQDVVEVRKEPSLAGELLEFPMASVFLLGLNSNGYEPFGDLRVRQAVSLAIDREEFCNIVWMGTTTPAYGIFPPGMPGFSAQKHQADLDRARALLAEAGYDDRATLPHLTITALGTFIHKAMAEYLGQSLEAIGFSTSVELLEMGAYMDGLNSGKLSLITVGWTADYIDSHNFLSALWDSRGPHNMVSYNDPEMDALLDRVARTLGEEERLSLLERAEEMALEDCSWIPLFYDRRAVLVKPHVKGIHHNAMGLLPLDGVSIEPAR